MELLVSEWSARCGALLAQASQSTTVSFMVGELEPLSIRLELAGTEGENLLFRIDPATGLSVAESATDLADVTIAGDAKAWADVLNGKVTYVEQVNVAHGAFAVQGDPVHLSWLLPVLSEVLSSGEKSEVAASVPAVPAVGAVTGKYVESLGSQVYVETAGAGPSVVLLHTAGRDARQWHPVMAQLADRFTLYAPDLPGRGRSECLNEGSGYLDNVHAIAEWVRKLVDSLGLESYLIAGCSLGGNLSLLLGATDARVRGVLALQGADLTPTISEGSLRMMDHPRVSLPHTNMNFTMSLVGDLASDEARQAIRRGVKSLNAPAQRADLTAYAHCDTRELMPDVVCPVVIFRGEDDWVVSDDMIRSTASRLTHASSLRVLTRPGIGHFPHIEDPLLVAGLLVELDESAR